MKKILIVNANSVNADNATGITIRSILSTYEKSDMYEIFWDLDGNGGLEIRSCKILSPRFSLRAVKNKNFASNMNNDMKKSDTVSEKSFKSKIKNTIRQYFVLKTESSRVETDRDIYEKIKNFNPDVIYTLGGGVSPLMVSYKLSKKLGIPIVIHYMDNWLHCLQWENNPLLYFYKRKLRRYAKLCRDRSSVGITISPKMAEEYTKETGIKHIDIMNSIKVGDFVCKKKDSDDEFTLVYAGGIHLGREKALVQVSEVIEKLAENSEKKIRFNIYTSDSDMSMYKDLFERFGHTHFKKYVPHDKIKEVYESADALIHIENDLSDNGFFKYSISTKISEYLSSGRPVVFFGPDNIYLYEFLKENKVAQAVSDVNSLENALRNLASNDSDRGMAENAVRYAYENFDTKIAAERFSYAVRNSLLPQNR